MVYTIHRLHKLEWQSTFFINHLWYLYRFCSIYIVHAYIGTSVNTIPQIHQSQFAQVIPTFFFSHSHFVISKVDSITVSYRISFIYIYIFICDLFISICIYKRANILCTRSVDGCYAAYRNIKLDSLSLKFIVLVNAAIYMIIFCRILKSLLNLKLLHIIIHIYIYISSHLIYKRTVCRFLSNRICFAFLSFFFFQNWGLSIVFLYPCPVRERAD